MSGQTHYKFFDEFDTYYSLDLQVESSKQIEQNAHFCDSLNLESNENSQIIDICKKYVKLIANVNIEYTPQGREQSNLNTYYEFMNYWLYYKLKDQGCDESTIKKFFDKLIPNRRYFATEKIPMDKICVIDDNYFNNIHALYQLYKICEQLKEEKLNYDQFLNQLQDKYNKGLKKCFREADNNFCIALKEFSDKYNSEKIIESRHCNKEKCRSLPKLILEKSLNNKPTIIAKIGTVLTRESDTRLSYGLSSISPQEYSNLSDLISLQYNLHMEKYEDDKNCFMMNILKEYFQYFQKNKNNPHLQYFVQEFIDKYYKAKESEYKNIFASCKPSDTSKEHCNIFKECIAKFNDDMSLIKTSSTKYIENKDEYFKRFDPNESLLQKALALIKDSEAMSRYSTTIISIIISIFLCIFFLYKLTPLSSICRKKKRRRKIPLFFPERIENLKDDNTRHKNVKPKRGKIRFSYQPT